MRTQNEQKKKKFTVALVLGDLHVDNNMHDMRVCVCVSSYISLASVWIYH